MNIVVVSIVELVLLVSVGTVDVFVIVAVIELVLVLVGVKVVFVVVLEVVGHSIMFRKTKKSVWCSGGDETQLEPTVYPNSNISGFPSLLRSVTDMSVAQKDLPNVWYICSPSRIIDDGNLKVPSPVPFENAMPSPSE